MIVERMLWLLRGLCNWESQAFARAESGDVAEEVCHYHSGGRSPLAWARGRTQSVQGEVRTEQKPRAWQSAMLVC